VDLLLSDAAASKFHCEIVLDDGKPVVRDLGSRNGTFINGVKVQSAFLQDGSILSVGETRIRFELGRKDLKVALSDRERFGLMVGQSAAMRAIFAALENAAASDATVLLAGETGTGKDVAAESIHQESTRKGGPFIVVDCSAISPQLIGSELFGHEKGAFTGADRARQGACETAHGGTLFLDEIGELPPALQPQLLRFLEKKEVQRIGSTDRHRVDVRVVAATNRNLLEEVNAKRFRSDLYYRLAVISVRLPPLRERLEDLPTLVAELANQVASGPAAKKTLSQFLSEEALAELRQHNWPGNLRELRNHIERALSLAPETLASTAGPPPLDLHQPLRVLRARWLQYFERSYLEALLARHDNNVSEAARAAGIARVHLHRLLVRAGLR
jgi:transcriptional regulator with PAS, ATPase and Fis domain